ncbi:DUF317 domain-containing protein [Streptomyces erythrochromogenes]|uniref:DUF317 domain-containing protein n=1 Tax=Streptomyces erythrochromogenes TaxID=285574 RepID=UPI00386E0C51|nr:DUF317 domain-containing protein [Streptomyces erythrochromogenes]
MTELAATDRVLVSPRYLAGAGRETITNVIGPLVHLFGWQPEQDQQRVRLSNPYSTTALEFTPESPNGLWWKITNLDPHWQIQISRQAPTEAVSAVAQSLPQLLGDHRHAERIPISPLSLREIAVAAQWVRAPDNSAYSSPDTHCSVFHRPRPGIAWSFEHAIHDGFDTHWTATFTDTVPIALVAQFFSHLVSSEPVEREYREIPFLARDLASAIITPVDSAGLGAHVHHALAQIPRPPSPGDPSRRL